MTKTFFVGALVVGALNFLLDSSGSSNDSKNPAFAITPTYQFEAGSKMEVRIDFSNRSDQTIRYVVGHRDDVFDLNFRLYSGSKSVRLLYEDRPPAAKVREVKPGEYVPNILPLHDDYGDLKPGRYELRVRGRDFSLTHDVTPLGFDERIVAYIAVEE